MAAPLEICSHVEQRAVIRFWSSEGVRPSDIYRRMKAQYGESCLNQNKVFKWASSFKEGRTSIEDELRSGRPKEAATPSNLEAVDKLVRADRRIKVEEIAESLSISIGTVHSILHEDLGYSKVCCRWVPKMLSDANKAKRLEMSRKNLDRVQKEGDSFLNRLVTCDETWVAHYEPESKQQSLRWKHPSSPVTKKFRVQRSVKKVMLTVFWDVRGPITVSFLEQGTTVNSENYCQLLQQVKKDIKNKRRGMQSRGVILHQDSARPHTATRTIETINQLGWELLDHPPYSPNLAPSDYHLFGALKSYTRGIHMETHDEVKATVSEWSRRQSAEFYADGIKKLVP
ncbi:histone-lysine N-methyltransferase SETMAR-like [Watersipora subatra]|uniref:histone-lysine N-methyltransferase SETMAR-like n=1 Tax=Watersipora subatra TaxID=2589382 RepID=UPI00355B9AA4